MRLRRSAGRPSGAHVADPQGKRVLRVPEMPVVVRYDAGRAPDMVFRPDGRFAMEVVTTSGRAASLEFRIRPDLVEIWRQTHSLAVFDRVLLRAWMAYPSELPLVADEVTFSLDRSVDLDGRVAVSLPDVSSWTLSPMAFDQLRSRL